MSVNTVIDILKQNQSKGLPLRMSSIYWCIGGQCEIYLINRNLSSQKMIGVKEAFRMVSEIEDVHIAYQVCFTCMEATYEEAIRMLEILRDEGVVNWNRAKFRLHPMNILRKIQSFLKAK